MDSISRRRRYVTLWITLVIANFAWSLVTGDHGAAVERSYFQGIALGIAAWRFA